ncbi:MAG: hypothetical protein CMK07_13955 [Ponticaulis sp.]|nr:hypothetical protein [Ponticaulis sp.]
MSKQKILDAAKSLLWDRGYEAMSPRAVMDESGAGQGSLYHHFGSKKDLSLEAIESIKADLLADAAEVFQSDLSPLEKLTVFLKKERASLKGCKIGRLAQEKSIIEDADLSALLVAYFQQLTEWISDTIAKAQETGKLRSSVTPQEAATLILSVIQGGYVLSRAEADSQKLSMAADAVLILLMTQNN